MQKMDTMLHVDCITPRREFVNISFFIILTLFGSLKVRSSCLFFVRAEKDFGLLIFSSIYWSKLFISQKP